VPGVMVESLEGLQPGMRGVLMSVPLTFAQVHGLSVTVICLGLCSTLKKRALGFAKLWCEVDRVGTSKSTVKISACSHPYRWDGVCSLDF
jgi:hypothetical protein